MYSNKIYEQFLNVEDNFGLINGLDVKMFQRVKQTNDKEELATNKIFSLNELISGDPS